ncbi:RNA polymerase sigma factor [Nocardia colli]|uniref:RNA polymerase sigma factor n=1 Tax=Nocardia colli TaxID=2545717 RepID=A0A5N0EA98_9NOCA|nr:RNA polymerase sigma factor [Nocardia colli]KAA8886358.1 RNA polymerase sigma factor [Nocardia colli]
MDTDEALLAAVARGDQACLRALYDRHAPAMLRVVRRMTAQSGVAEEILQETWLAVWRSADSFRGESSARGWLFGVAKRQAHNYLRKSVLVTVDIDETAEMSDQAGTVEDIVLANAARTELAVGIRDLPEHLREVLLLVLVDDMSYPDVAAILGIPVGTVKSRMSHARKRLALALAGTTADLSTRYGGEK